MIVQCYIESSLHLTFTVCVDAVCVVLSCPCLCFSLKVCDERNDLHVTELKSQLHNKEEDLKTAQTKIQVLTQQLEMIHARVKHCYLHYHIIAFKLTAFFCLFFSRSHLPRVVWYP